MLLHTTNNVRLFTFLATLALLGCGDDTRPADADANVDTEPFDFGTPDTSVDLGDVAFDTPEPDMCTAVERLTAIRMRSAPGGRQLHVSLRDNEGHALDAGFGTCLQLSDARLGDLPLVHSVAPAEPGATLIVARWTPDDVEASRLFINEFLAQRPVGERVAVWAWSDDLVQVVGATDDFAFITRRLDTLWAADSTEPGDTATLAAAAAEEWEKLSDDALLGPRTIVFVAPSLQLDSLPDIDRDYLTDFWVLAAATGNRRYVGTSDADISDAATSIATAIDTVYDEGLAVLAFCDDGGVLELEVTAAERVIRRVSFGDAAIEHIGAGCDLQVILDAAPDPEPVIQIDFTDEERTRFDELGANRDSGADWTGEITLPGEEFAAPFEGSYRGRSSLGCERKSMSVNLDGGDARHVVPGSGGDQFFLISMCLDNRYVNQINGDRLMQMFGLWDIEWTTTELRVDDESRGIYLFVEEIDRELRNDRSRLRSVIRRRTDIDGKPADIEYSFDGDDDAARQRYESFLASIEGLSGDELVATLQDSMDLEQYLTWVALMTLLGNGDYVDEVFFVAEESVGADHEVRDYYQVHGWDPDDLFSACHHNGRFALEDPNGLLYCTESVLDHAIFADADVYGLYVDTLDWLIAELTPERFRSEAESTRNELLAWFAVQEIRDAMVELLEANSLATEHDIAIAEITDATEALIAAFEASRLSLSESIAAYREAQ